MKKNVLSKKTNTITDKIYIGLAYVLPILFALLIIFPFVNVLAKSFSSSASIVSGNVKFLPKTFSTASYQYIIESGVFFKAFLNTMFVVIIGTPLSVIITAMVAYPLSKPNLKGRKVFLLLYMFTMVFSAGIIPDYLLVKALGLTNSLWSLILPGLVWTYNMLILKSYFEGIPSEIEESAQIDGAGYGTIFTRLIIPLSKPALATVGLFYGVSYWNDYYKALLYINDIAVKPLQLYLFEIITQSASMGDTTTMNMKYVISAEGVRCASIILTVIPMLIIYPFVQKFFASGVTLGAVKE